jgi:hypothetical protein
VSFVAVAPDIDATLATFFDSVKATFGIAALLGVLLAERGQRRLIWSTNIKTGG